MKSILVRKKIVAKMIKKKNKERVEIGNNTSSIRTEILSQKDF